MSTDVLGQWPEWRDNLIIALRMKDVPGDDIGVILAEVADHVAETGESPEEAFGNAGEYAKSRATAGTLPTESALRRNLALVGIALCTFAGGAVSARAAWSLGAGDFWWGSIPVVLALVVGFTLLVWPMSQMKPDLVTDPRSGQPIQGHDVSATRMSLIWFGTMLVVVAVLGWVLG